MSSYVICKTPEVAGK